MDFLSMLPSLIILIREIVARYIRHISKLSSRTQQQKIKRTAFHPSTDRIMRRNKKRPRGQGGGSSSHGNTKRAMLPNNGEPIMQADMIKTLQQTMESLQTAVAPLASELREVKRVNDELRKDLDGVKETLEKNKTELEKLKQARSQPNQTEQRMVPAEARTKTPSYRFKITSKVNDKVYTRRKIETDKNDSIEVVLLRDGEQLEPADPFRSISAQLFLLEGDFKGVDKGDWDEGYFVSKIITPGSGKSETDMNIEDKSIRTFQLTNGIFSLSDLQFKNNSNRKDIRLGVRAAATNGVRAAATKEERILEGISNPFKVQECKTKKLEKSKTPSLTDPICRLERVRKGSEAVETLRQRGIETVEQLLRWYYQDEDGLEKTLRDECHYHDTDIKKILTNAFNFKIEGELLCYTENDKKLFIIPGEFIIAGMEFSGRLRRFAELTKSEQGEAETLLKNSREKDAKCYVGYKMEDGRPVPTEASSSQQNSVSNPQSAVDDMQIVPGGSTSVELMDQSRGGPALDGGNNHWNSFSDAVDPCFDGLYDVCNNHRNSDELDEAKTLLKKSREKDAKCYGGYKIVDGRPVPTEASSSQQISVSNPQSAVDDNRGNGGVLSLNAGGPALHGASDHWNSFSDAVDPCFDGLYDMSIIDDWVYQEGNHPNERPDRDGPFNVENLCGQVRLGCDKNVRMSSQCVTTLHGQFLPMCTRRSIICSGSWSLNWITEISLVHGHNLRASGSEGPFFELQATDSVRASTKMTLHGVTKSQRKRVLLQPIECFDSYDEPSFKRKRHEKYHLGFVNKAAEEFRGLLLNQSARLNRSQQDQNQTPRFILRIISEVKNLVYRGRRIQTNTEDCIKVVMYDGGNQIAPSHPLSSAAVELVLLDGEFNKDGQDYWSEGDFSKSIIKPQYGNTIRGNGSQILENSKFNLIRGVGRHHDAIITERFSRKNLRLGVMVMGHTEERVLEGISNAFKVRGDRIRGSRESTETCRTREQGRHEV